MPSLTATPFWTTPSDRDYVDNFEQKRYPTGHPKGGQYMPKDADDQGDRTEEDTNGDDTRAVGGDEASAGSVRDRGGVGRGRDVLDEQAGQESDAAQADAAGKPLDDLLDKVVVDGYLREFGPSQVARDAAADYYRETFGAEMPRVESYVPVDPERAARIGQAYEEMEHNPNDPQVREAYEALARETIGQYKAMIATGVEIEFMPDSGDPYGNPRNALLDIQHNNHMYVFSTEDGYGTDGISDEERAQNPLLAETDYTWGGKPVLVNDLFRAVHDYFGHYKEGVGFRARGEENAWQQHMPMFSPLAARAMTSETRGQNSWVNYGPHAEFNRTASGADTVYADQKIGLMPEWVMTEGYTPTLQGQMRAHFQQERYPEGHPKGGQFKPKDADDEGDRIEAGETGNAKSGTTNQDGDDALSEGNYRPAVVNWAKQKFGDRVAPNGKPAYENFVRWFGDSQVVDNDGQPLMLFHGTVRDFTGEFTFGKSAVESDFGAGIYLTSSAQDAGNNYADPEGPDVKNRIETLTMEIFQLSEDFITLDEARAKAKAAILENQGVVIPAMVRMENPVVLGYGILGRGANERTVFDYKAQYDDDGDLVEESGSVIDLVDALRSVAAEFEDFTDSDVDDAVGSLVEAVDNGGVSAEKVESIIKDKAKYAYDDQGMLANGEIARSVFEKMGFDGIIDRTVKNKFRGMPNLPVDTTHYIAFGSSQIKSPQNNGDFGDDPRVLFNNGGGPERYPEGHPKGGQFKPKDADDEGDRIDAGQTATAKSGTTNQDGDDAFQESNYRSEVVNWAKDQFGDRVAPNGKPAYENFVRWFGDSKIVDAEGQPLRVFHGTDAEFDTFASSGWMSGGLKLADTPAFFFTDNANMAATYSQQGNVMEVYLKADRVAEISARGLHWSEWQSDALDAARVSTPAQQEFNDLKDRLAEQQIQQGLPDYDYDQLSEQDQQAVNDAAQAAFESVGQDARPAMNAVIVRDAVDRGPYAQSGALGGDVYVVFDPSQIKSTQNKGDFGDDPRVLFSNPSQQERSKPKRKRYPKGHPRGGQFMPRTEWQ